MEYGTDIAAALGIRVGDLDVIGWTADGASVASGAITCAGEYSALLLGRAVDLRSASGTIVLSGQNANALLYGDTGASYENKLICFSAGKEGDKFVKYDFSLRNADLHELESYLLSEHSYYRADKVKMLKNFLSESNTAYDNHVLGIRVDAATGKRCVAVCPYFRLQKSGSTCFAEKFTDDAVVSVLGCRSAFFYPRCGDERLHMTALDFAPEAFKLKFYAEYDVPKRAYDLPSEFFDRSVQDKLNSVIKKGYELQFIQTAISENKAVTYNLYFKPCA